MNIGVPQREYYVEPVELPEPLQPEKTPVETPEEQPEKAPA
jgi:hypothetical protein